MSTAQIHLNIEQLLLQPLHISQVFSIIIFSADNKLDTPTLPERIFDGATDVRFPAFPGRTSIHLKEKEKRERIRGQRFRWNQKKRKSNLCNAEVAGCFI